MASWLLFLSWCKIPMALSLVLTKYSHTHLACRQMVAMQRCQVCHCFAHHHSHIKALLHWSAAHNPCDCCMQLPIQTIMSNLVGNEHVAAALRGFVRLSWRRAVQHDVSHIAAFLPLANTPFVSSLCQGATLAHVSWQHPHSLPE